MKKFEFKSSVDILNLFTAAGFFKLFRIKRKAAGKQFINPVTMISFTGLPRFIRE